ncbi:MAG: DUF4861 domain-containing protein [Muribaculaceae bacterium]|nr:DUF4861 domain-containing protein [Muribaculaceae bacterium]
MKSLAVSAATVIGMALSSCAEVHTITVSNDSDIERSAEIVEIDAGILDSIMRHKPFRILDADNRELPYQRTFDGKVIFPASVGARKSVKYTVSAGMPAETDTLATGNIYPRRKDDLTWENDRCAYRAYGPALQQSGERAFGYDVWTKSVAVPVVAKRYEDAFSGAKNLHEDYGDGMDVYTVGPTLGAGTGALMDSCDALIYPYCFKSFEILDNGPLRFTVKLAYDSGAGDNVSETRLISLDAGAFLNRTSVCFNGLHRAHKYAPGIVLHRQNPDGYSLHHKESVMAYADLTDNEHAGNGIIFIGIVAPQADTLCVRDLPSAEGDATGHLLAKSIYEPGDTYTYYWGAGWSKGAMPDWQTWKEYLLTFRRKLEKPLKTEIK